MYTTEYKIKETPKLTKRSFTFKEGDVYNLYTIICNNYYGLESSNHHHVKCRCNCGFINYVRIDMLKNGKRKGCFECSHKIRERDYKEVGGLCSLMFSKIKRNAVIRNLEFNLNMTELWELFIAQDQKCALTNLPLILVNHKKLKIKISEVTASLDRIDSSKGYIPDNVQWVHKAVNIMKGSLNNSEFINICKAVAETHKNYKDNFEPSQLNGYMKRFIYNTFQRSKLEGATHSD